MATGWYVLHTYSGYENKIEKAIRMMIGNGELDRNVVRDVKIQIGRASCRERV